MTKCKYCQIYTPDDYGTCPHCGAPLDPFNACKIGEHGCQKIVINTCYGGFHPSVKAIMRWAELSGIEMHCVIEENFMKRDWNKPAHYKNITAEEAKSLYFVNFCTKPLNPDGTMDEDSSWYWGKDEKKFRTDPNFIQAVEELGVEANTEVSNLRIVEIPDEIKWVIEEYDGVEWIAEIHRTWD